MTVFIPFIQLLIVPIHLVHIRRSLIIGMGSCCSCSCSSFTEILYRYFIFGLYSPEQWAATYPPGAIKRAYDYYCTYKSSHWSMIDIWQTCSWHVNFNDICLIWLFMTWAVTICTAVKQAATAAFHKNTTQLVAAILLFLNEWFIKWSKFSLEPNL